MPCSPQSTPTRRTAATTRSCERSCRSSGHSRAPAGRRGPASSVHERPRQSGRSDGDCYLTGGATAVLLGWREATIDVNLQLVPEQDGVLRRLPELKNELEINVELVSPADFVPLPPDASDRHLYIGRQGRLTFFHVDPYAQVLAKLERGHVKDLEDVQAMLDLGLVERVRLLELTARSSLSSTATRRSTRVRSAAQSRRRRTTRKTPIATRPLPDGRKREPGANACRKLGGDPPDPSAARQEMPLAGDPDDVGAIRAEQLPHSLAVVPERGAGTGRQAWSCPFACPDAATNAASANAQIRATTRRIVPIITNAAPASARRFRHAASRHRYLATQRCKAPVVPLRDGSRRFRCHPIIGLVPRLAGAPRSVAHRSSPARASRAAARRAVARTARRRRPATRRPLAATARPAPRARPHPRADARVVDAVVRRVDVDAADDVALRIQHRVREALARWRSAGRASPGRPDSPRDSSGRGHVAIRREPRRAADVIDARRPGREVAFVVLRAERLQRERLGAEP